MPNYFFVNSNFIKSTEVVMKSLAIKISFLTILIAGVAAVSAFGQSTQYKGTIPFDFTARGVQMKAGDYVLSTKDHALMLRDRKSGAASIIGLTGIDANYEAEAKGTLAFVRDGDNYILSEVNTPEYKLRVKHTATSVNVARNSKPEKVVVNIAAGN